MLHGSSGCHCCGRIVQRGRRMVLMQLVLMVVGSSLLTGLLLAGSLNLWRRLNRCGRNLRLMEAGRSRIERNRQHFLEAHPRDTPRYIPGTRMVLHLRFVNFLRTSSLVNHTLNIPTTSPFALSYALFLSQDITINH